MSENNYRTIEVRSQAELDAIPVDFHGRIFIKFGMPFNRAIVRQAFAFASVEAWENSSVVAWDNSSVVAYENSSVVARDNSSVVAWDNSSVVAYGNSSVKARDNSSVVAWENSSVVAYGNSSVKARDNSSVVARENSSVVAWENSSVEAWENSSVEAYGNSSVKARDNSSVVAYGNSSVKARDNSSVVARENSSVVAWENSSVEAWENSSVEAWDNSSVVGRGNVQIVARTKTHKIKTSGNARIVYMPKTIHEFLDFYGVKHTKTKAVMYKAVHKDGNGYFSDHDRTFRYAIGAKIREEADPDVSQDCGRGIHISHLDWALRFGQRWHDLAILEVETKIADIVLPVNSDGKVRTSEVKVLREVPLEECGIYGKILAKRRSAR